MRLFLSRTSVLAAALALAACDGGEAVHSAPPPRIVVPEAERTVSWLPTHVEWVSVQVVDGDGRPMPGVPVTLALRGPGTLRPLASATDADGGVTAVYDIPYLDTTAVVEARAQGVPEAVSLRLRVVALPVEVNPQSVVLSGGDCAAYLTAVMKSFNESVGLDVDFSVDDAGVARVYEPVQPGTYAGRRVVLEAAGRAGATRVIARHGHRADTVDVRVQPECVAPS